MNGAIRAIVRVGIKRGFEVYGVYDKASQGLGHEIPWRTMVKKFYKSILPCGASYATI